MRNNRFRYLLRYFLVRNKFATYYFLQSTESLQKKNFFKYISRSFKLAPPRVQVFGLYKYVGSELERSEFEKLRDRCKAIMQRQWNFPLWDTLSKNFTKLA